MDYHLCMLLHIVHMSHLLLFIFPHSGKSHKHGNRIHKQRGSGLRKCRIKVFQSSNSGLNTCKGRRIEHFIYCTRKRLGKGCRISTKLLIKDPVNSGVYALQLSGSGDDKVANYISSDVITLRQKQ